MHFVIVEFWQAHHLSRSGNSRNRFRANTRRNNALSRRNVIPRFFFFCHRRLSRVAIESLMRSLIAGMRGGEGKAGKSAETPSFIVVALVSPLTIAYRAQIIKFTKKGTVIDVRNRSRNDDATTGASINCQNKRKREARLRGVRQLLCDVSFEFSEKEGKLRIQLPK